MDAALPLLREFGFPIALCCVLIYAIWMKDAVIQKSNAALVKALNERIDILEKLVDVNTQEIKRLEADRIARADEYGHTLKDMAIRYSQTIRDHDALMRDALSVLRRLTDSITVRPCLMDQHGYRPHPTPPTSGELPKDPSKDTTARFHNGG